MFQNKSEIDDSDPNVDPLSSVIQDLSKLTTESSILPNETVLPNKAHEEFIDESIGSPDSLDTGFMGNRPIPPPRTKVPMTVNANCNDTALHSANTSVHKQMRSESDTDLLLSLTASGYSLS